MASNRPPDPLVTCPLSRFQRQVWSWEQLHPGSGVYNIAMAHRIRGSLPVGRIDTAVQHLFRSHPLLGAFVSVRDGHPLLCYWADGASDVKLQQVNLSGEPEHERMAYIAALAEQSFTLTSGPLGRATLVRMGADDHVLILTVHHLAGDATTFSILYRDLAHAYDALGSGRRLVAEPDQRYAAYARQEAAQDASPRYATLLDAASRRVARSAAPADLPFTGPLDTEDDHRGGSVCFTLPASLTDQVRAISLSHRVSVPTVLLAAYALVLSRYVPGGPFVIVLTTSTRVRPEWQTVVGPFLNVALMPVNPHSARTFAELVQLVRGEMLDALAEQDAALPDVQTRIYERLDVSSPLLRFQFGMFDSPFDVLELPPLAVEPLDLSSGTAKADVKLDLVDRRSHVAATLTYNANRLSDVAADRLAHQYQSLLAAVVTDPDAELRFLDMPMPRPLPSDGPPAEVTAIETVWDRVQQCAQEAPASIALEDSAGGVSYGQLVSRVRDIAGGLMRRGLTPGECVAVAGPRGASWAIALLAGMAAGGIALPIDPALPDAFQEQMLQHGRVRWLLCTDARSAHDWQSRFSHVQVLEVGASGSSAREAGTALWRAVGACHPAYAFFTSGSTGKPRAIVGRSDSLLHFLLWQAEEFQIGPGDRCAVAGGLSFDVVLRECLMPLIAGGTACFVPESSARDPAAVAAWLAASTIDVLHAVPTISTQWVRELEQQSIRLGVRLLFFAGEPLREATVTRWRSRLPPTAEIVNLYGPTETTLARTFFRVPQPAHAGIQPVGRPIPGTTIDVVDAAGHRLGSGLVGEIRITTTTGTLGLMSDDPAGDLILRWSGQSDSAMEHGTGDLGRYRPDGLLEVTGRISRTVKVHGVRVEPAAVESLLLAHADVDAVAVVAGQQDDDGLTAYVVPRQGKAASPAGLRRYLAARIPTAWIPARIMFTGQLPATANGKLDTSALLSTLTESPGPSPAAEVPRDAIDDVLEAACIELLGKVAVGPDTDFFAIGGNSLIAARLVGIIERGTGARLKIRDVFDTGTLGELAERARSQLIADRMSDGET